MSGQSSKSFRYKFDSFNKLIKFLREQARINSGKMAELTGIHRNSQTNYEKDRDPSVDYLISFSHETNHSFWSLLAERIRLGTAPEHQKEHVLKQLDKFEAGLGGESQEPGDSTVGANVTAHLTRQMKRLAANSTDLIVVTQQGESMSPVIRHGDVMLVDKTDSLLSDSGLYIFRIDEETIAKRVQRLPDGKINLLADNPMFDTMTIDAESVIRLSVAGRVIMSMNRQLTT